jgi:hypothetical protein
VVIVIVVMVVIVAIPIIFRLPSMFSAIPPLVILLPAPLAFGVQLVASRVSLAAMLAIVMDRLIQPRFRFFDGVLAMRSVIGPHLRRSRKEQHQSPGD